MLAEAFYKDGKIELVQKYRFKHNQFRVSIDLPDEELIADKDVVIPEEIATEAQALLAKYDAIRNAPLQADTIPELTEKQLQRIEAFELRAQLRREQGRPV